MAEKFLVRFSDRYQESLEWLCLDSPDSEPQSGCLADAAEAATGKEAVLLLPASEVLLQEIDLPVKSNVQIKKALPFAMEELLAEDVEHYHFAWFRLPLGKLAVAAVAHEKLAAYVERFRKVGLELDGVYPDCLCLPYRPGAVSVLFDDDLALMRLGQCQGGCIEIAFFPRLLSKLSDDASVHQLYVWARHMPADFPFEYCRESYSTPLQLFAEGYHADSELNFLSGPYAPKHKSGDRWRQWIPALVIAVIAMMIQYAGLLNQNRQQRNSLAMLETQTLDLFKQSFPEVKRIVNVKAQADQQLAELKKGAATSSGFMRILFKSGEFLKGNLGVRLRKLNFVNDSLQLQLEATDIGELERFKQDLQSQLQVRILSADNGVHGVEAQLEIREK